NPATSSAVKTVFAAASRAIEGETSSRGVLLAVVLIRTSRSSPEGRRNNGVFHYTPSPGNPPNRRFAPPEVFGHRRPIQFPRPKARSQFLHETIEWLN